MKPLTINKESHGSEITGNETTERIAYSVKEAAQALGCTRAFVYGLLAQGVLSSVKVGGRRFISVKAIEELVEVFT